MAMAIQRTIRCGLGGVTALAGSCRFSHIPVRDDQCTGHVADHAGSKLWHSWYTPAPLTLAAVDNPKAAPDG
jgi:hypothetical protein